MFHRSVEPFYSSTKEWADSLSYERPLENFDRYVYVNPETGRRKTLAHLASFDNILIEDELGEKSVEAFEQYIKEHGG